MFSLGCKALNFLLLIEDNNFMAKIFGTSANNQVGCHKSLNQLRMNPVTHTHNTHTRTHRATRTHNTTGPQLSFYTTRIVDIQCCRAASNYLPEIRQFGRYWPTNNYLPFVSSVFMGRVFVLTEPDSRRTKEKARAISLVG